MTDERILENNLFKDCSQEELRILWNGMKRFYEDGFFAEDNPVTPYKNKYCERSNIGVIQTEQDLLRAIVVKFV